LPRQFPEADNRRILIVDDEEAITTLFALALSERYECVTAADLGALNACGLSACD